MARPSRLISADSAMYEPDRLVDATADCLLAFVLSVCGPLASLISGLGLMLLGVPIAEMTACGHAAFVASWSVIGILSSSVLTPRISSAAGRYPLDVRLLAGLAGVFVLV